MWLQPVHLVLLVALIEFVVVSRLPWGGVLVASGVGCALCDRRGAAEGLREWVSIVCSQRWVNCFRGDKVRVSCSKIGKSVVAVRVIVSVNRTRIVVAERGYSYRADPTLGAKFVFVFVGGIGTHPAGPNGRRSVGCMHFGFHLCRGLLLFDASDRRLYLYLTSITVQSQNEMGSLAW